MTSAPTGRARRASPWRVLRAAMLGLSFHLCLLQPARASDASEHRILLVAQGKDPLLERVAGEVKALGFFVIRAAPHGPLDHAARTARAAAAIRVLPSRKGVEVWLAAASPGRPLLRQMVVDESQDGPDGDLIALQTAELLRTSLLGETAQASAAPAPAATGQPASVVPQTPSEGEHDQLRGHLGLGTLVSPGGGASAPLQLDLSLAYAWGPRWGVALDFGLPLSPGAITAAEGSASLETFFGGAAAFLRLVPEPRPWFASVGVGGAVLRVDVAGRAQAPLRSRQDGRFTGGVYARADGGLEVTRWLRLGVRVLAATSFPRIALTFAGNDAGSFGSLLFGVCGFVALSSP